MLHSVSAMEGAQNGRLDNAGSKDRWLAGLLGLSGAGLQNNHDIKLYKGQKLTRKLGAWTARGIS